MMAATISIPLSRQLQATHTWTGLVIFRLQITKCNQAIFDLGGEDENNAEQEALIAPALAMRAFYHLFLWIHSEQLPN